MSSDHGVVMEDCSDEEGEILPDSIDEYYFVDQSDRPIEFSVLPFVWSKEESGGCSGRLVYLRGKNSFYKLAKAWKFDLSGDEEPKIEVILHGLQWITLQKPGKSYEALIRTTLVTLQCLHFVKRNPEASSGDVWNSLQKVDGIQPSEDDLSDHVSLVCQAMRRDEDLTKSKCLRTFLEKTSETILTEEELPTLHQQEDAQAPMEYNFIVDNETEEESIRTESSDQLGVVMEDCTDEEGEIQPHSIDEYFFVDQSDRPIEFSVLPLVWSKEESGGSSGMPVYLCGDESFYKLAIAWKFDLSDDEEPKIEVILHGLQWITLQKPRHSYEALIRTTLVTLRCLHFVQRNPEASGDDVWNSLQKVDGIQPSEDDLSDHVSLVCQAMRRDEDLTKSKCLRTFVEKTSETTLTEEELPTLHQQEDAQAPMEDTFMVDNETEVENSSDDDSETNLMFDTVCSLCDNGGYVLCCEGSCLRSFHPTIDDGSDTACESLGFPNKAQVDALGTYLCNNCLYKQHQCYACGQLGSSDENSAQEVFPCSASNCGHFYHPVCVAKLLCADDQIKSDELQVKIAARESFCCPLHICKVCHLREDKNLFPFHFAVCRRCPTAYHRKCIPREITSELNFDEYNFQRSWERLLPYNRILIYCLDHEIEAQLLTPTRDHILFPDKSGQRRTQSHGLPRFKENVSSREVDHKHHGDLFSRLGVHEYRKGRKSFNASDYLMKRKIDSTERLSKEGPSASAKPDRVDEEENIESRVLSICNKVDSEFSFDDFVKSRGVTHIKCYRTGNDLSKITLGLVQTHVKAARAAAKMFEEGRDEEAKAIFDPQTLHELIKHKRQLEIYLSPFLHGMRYTSFGRHFTKNEKLQEIVERLHWYVQNGDTVVDFCCGSNDFSLFMKEKLEKTGKECFFKNFDLIIPKNDFNFEKRDWLSVRTEELPDGSQLIMGLNPPFGYKASLANTFIRKALEFKPKILILIVPKDTKRVSKMADYDLIWEDTSLLSGMSFYLPGSLDVNDKPLESWNKVPPPLSLWSRKDWTKSHKIKALDQGHIKQFDHTIYQQNFRHAEIPPRSEYDCGMVEDMEISD